MDYLSLIDMDTALSLVRHHIPPLTGRERVSVGAACGRVVCADVAAPYDVPSYPKAQMDGYAVSSTDLYGASDATPVRLSLCGAAHAGDEVRRSVTSGTCVYVATGAAVPDGADAVLMREDAGEGDDTITARAPVLPGQHIMRPGYDIGVGTVLVRRGTRVTPRLVALLAGAGVSEISCFPRPRVAVFSTGTEVIDPSCPPAYGRTHDANGPQLCAALAALGAVPVPRGIVPDDRASLAAAVASAAGLDAIILSAGVSKGHRDHVLGALSDAGCAVHFHGIAVKPGKPTVFATLSSVPVFGLPGHPVSCYTLFTLLVRPAILALSAMENPLRTACYPLAKRLSVPVGRRQYLPVRIADGKAVPVFRGSGALSSLMDADGFAVLDVLDEYLDEGDVVKVVLFDE